MPTYDEKVSKQYSKLHYKKPISELLKEYEISAQDLESAQKIIKLISNNDDNEHRSVTTSILYTELPYMTEQLSLNEQKEELTDRFTSLLNKASSVNEILVFKRILSLIRVFDDTIYLDLDEIKKAYNIFIVDKDYINANK